jgi:hypothetical protein
VPLDRVRFNRAVGEDEIDLESGFLMMPQAIPVVHVPITEETGTTVVAPDTAGGDQPLILTPPPSDGRGGVAVAGPQTSVEINFSADRDHLFSAWNAIANLADLAGKVNVTVRADSAQGFDKSKLQNGVLEPLRESDLIE